MWKNVHTSSSLGGGLRVAIGMLKIFHNKKDFKQFTAISYLNIRRDNVRHEKFSKWGILSQ